MWNSAELATSLDVEARVGHPQRMWDALVERIQERAITQFATIQSDWLALMWSMDAFRVAGVTPAGMGRSDLFSNRRLDAVYRGSKGNWFASVIALLLQNQTSQVIRPRTRVQGFSQFHQIDLAWPAREVDPLVCIETKVTGAPGYSGTPPRGAMADFSNRRKELKFAATDLKLNRRQQETSIEHWDVWRASAPPKTYFLWAARLREPPREDRIGDLVSQSRALVDSYLDGAGIVAWRSNADRTSYQTAAIPPDARVATLDDVLYRVASEIRASLTPGGRAPDPVRPDVRAVDIDAIDRE